MGRKADGVAVRTGECDICLEHALARRCCGGVFCAHCYGEKAHCPQCGVPVGAIQGLPITPHFLITIVDAGLYVVYATRMRCPCLHHCYECSEMHSRLRMLIVFTDDPMSFHEQLKGPSQTS